MRTVASRALAALALGVFVPSLAHAAPKPPKIHVRPAHPNGYETRSSRHPKLIIIHKAEGENASGWFQNPKAGVSAHYDVHKNGDVFRSVLPKNVAYHVKGANERSIGIEHGGFTAKNDTTEAQYRNSARLVAWLAKRYKIPIDRAHVKGHSQMPGNDHTDPGAHWKWTHYMNLIRRAVHPIDRLEIRSIKGSLTFKPGATHVIKVRVKNVGDRTWKPANTVMKKSTGETGPVHGRLEKTTAPNEVGLFELDVSVPKTAKPGTTIVRRLGVFHDKKRVKGGIVTLKLKVT
jgi:N-acetyl-anhydromuramyl-L-alanine amidase AmpD